MQGLARIVQSETEVISQRCINKVQAEEGALPVYDRQFRQCRSKLRVHD